MYGVQALTLTFALLAAEASNSFNGRNAFEWTQKVVQLGPRPVGSTAHQKTQRLIIDGAKAAGCVVEEDSFTAQTPTGPRQMKNIIAKAPGKSGKTVVVSGHYDTKVMPKFTGANDAGSSTGFLLTLASTECKKPRNNSLFLVWFDGEEAMKEWTNEDSLYGSRHLAARWLRDGTLPGIRALINVDMIGDADLQVLNDMNSTEWLRRMIWSTAAELGYSKFFATLPGAIGDDHMPFLEKGVPAVDLIDFVYGPNNSYWHTERDTLDKLSPQSFQIVGDVVVKVLRKLEQ